MTLEEIKKAVDEGKTVHWASPAYEVMKDTFGRYNIICILNDYCIGLTWQDGVTMNGDEDQFYIKPEMNEHIYTLREIMEGL